MHLLRSLLHTLWMMVTVVPWALIMLVASLWRRGTPLWWMAVRWLGWAGRLGRVLNSGPGQAGKICTGFGPIRADIAIPLDADKRDGAFQIYLSIGQSF